MLRFVFGVILAWIWHNPDCSYYNCKCFAKSEISASETKRFFVKTCTEKLQNCIKLCVFYQKRQHQSLVKLTDWYLLNWHIPILEGERGGSVVECRTPEREVRGSRPTAAVLCPWARHFTPRKYWLITQEAMAPSRYDWKIVDWDVKPQHNQPTNPF